MDKLTPEQRKKNMQSVKSHGSVIENMLCNELKVRGYKYRRNYSRLVGKPDIVFLKQKIVVFCDSEFWHGWNWKEKKKEIKSNKKFWYAKIESNIRRDKTVNRILKKEGWIVIRFWGKQIIKTTDKCVNTIEAAISRRKNEI